MYYHVPQSRERVIIIGVREDLGIEPSHPKPQGKPIPVETIKIISGPRLEHSLRVAALWNRLKPGMNGSDLPEQKGNSFGLQKINPTKPCPTILKGWTAGTGLLHWKECRFLSIPEMSQIASFGISFQWAGIPKQVVERIGNSVPPLLMKAIALHIKDNILSTTIPNQSGGNK